MTTPPPPARPAIFNLPVEKMRAGYYSDKYFVRAREILQADADHPHVTMQVFGKQHAFLGGIDEAIAILKLCSDRWSDLVVHALYDGDEVEPWETVLLIEGPYDAFAHLETLYLGVLARRTRVGTNTRRVVEAAAPKEVMFFPARHDHWLVQTGDGYAAHIAGAIGVSTDAQASWWGSEGIGTVPHALIAAYGGDTVRATQKFAEYMPPSVRLVTLVDFENDCVRTSLEVAEALGDKLYGVRIDTSEMLVDKSVCRRWAASAPPASIRSWCGTCAPRSTPRVHGSADRGLGRVHGGQDPRVRPPGGAGGRLRRRVLALPGSLRLHRRRRAARREAVRESGARLPPQPAARARDMSGALFWDVDTQHDFMRADRQLYVPGAARRSCRTSRP